MCEPAELCTFIEGTDRVGAERAEAHRRYVEDRGRIGLAASVAADRNTEAGRVGDGHRPSGVRDEFITIFIDVDERAEGAVADFVLGSRVYERTLASRERRFLMVVLEEILPDARTNILEEPSEAAHDRIVAAYRMKRLSQIVKPDAG